MQTKSAKAERLQTKIYRKMPAKKKLEIATQFYQAGRILNKSKNAAPKSPNRNSNSSR